MAAEKKGKVILAYSGGLDTSVAIPWLHEQGYEVVTLTMHVGQQADNLEEIKEKAYVAGASKAYVVDLREAFIDTFVWPSLKANGVYQGVYPLNSALSRPMIAQALIWCAEKEGAIAVAHGCTGKGQDQVRIEVACNALNPEIEVLAPVRDWGFTREEEMDYAAAHNVPVPTTRKSPYSIDDNLWGRSIECGILEDPWNEPPKDAYKLTVDPVDAPDEEVTIEITFEGGVPVAINGEKMGSIELIDYMNKAAGKAGFGRIDMIEDRLVGFKSREVYECPGALALIAAHKKLETLTLSKDVLKTKKELEVKFGELTYEGYWFSPLMLRRSYAEIRQRHRPHEALQRQLHHRRHEVRHLRIQQVARDLLRRRHLRPVRLRRLHQNLGNADKNLAPGPQREKHQPHRQTRNGKRQRRDEVTTRIKPSIIKRRESASCVFPPFFKHR